MKKNYIGLFRRKEPTDNPKKNINGSSSSKNGWLMSAFAAATLLLGGNSYAQTNIANYTFAKSTGATYTPITGGTKLFPSGTNTTYDSDVSAAITLPTATPFTYGGVVVTTVYVSANGFITFGAAPSGTTSTPLATLEGTGAISAFGQDGGFSSSDTTQPAGNHEVRYQDLGTEFVVQWQDHANYFNRATERLNFQIRLNYATGVINIIYGNCTDPGTVSTSGTTVYVGIRGNSTTYATNVNNLRLANIPAGTTCDWSNAVTGYDNTSTSSLLFSGTTNVNMKIPNGLQFTWTPGTQAPVRTFAATSAITTSGATLNWTAPTGATSYNVQYRIPGTCVWTNWSGNPVATNTAVLTGLDQGTTYQARIQALNGSTQSIYSHIPNAAGTGDGYSLTGTFKTLANCTSTVTGLASSAITPNTATVSWTASTAAPANGYEYYYSTSSAIPAYTVTPSGITAAGVITTNLAGLTPSTTYYYWVRANCDGVNKGAWSSSANFTTLGLCPTVTAPTANATGVSTTPTITWTAISGATGYKVNVGTTSGGSDIVANADVPTGTSYAITTPLNNGTIYYYSVTAYTATTAAPATPCTIRSFTTILSCISTVTGLASSAITPNTATISWTASTTPPANGYEYYYATTNTAPTATATASGSTAAGITTANLSLLNPSTQYYYWVRTNCNGTDKGAWSSSANFTTLATCIVPTALTVASATITTSGATASWTAPSTVPLNGYEVYYSMSSTAPTSTTVLNTTNSATSTTTSAPISGLSPSTMYYVWVRSVCIGTDRSVWTAVASFTTLCQPPVLISVTGATVCPGSTAVLSATAATGATINWYSSPTGGSALATGNSFTTPAVAATTNYYVSASTGSEAAVGPISPTAQGGTIGTQTTAWGVYYTTTVTAKLKSVDIFPITTGQTGSIKIVSGSQSVGAGTALATIPFTTNVSGGATAQTITIDVELPAGSYTIYPTLPTAGLSRNTSGATYPYTSPIANVTGNGYDVTYYMCFYNFKFSTGCESARQTVVATADPTACLGTSEIEAGKNNIKVYPNPFADVLNISDVKNVKSVSVMDITGRLVKTIEKPSSALQLGELKSGMYIVVLNMNDGSKQTIKAIKK